MQIMMKNKAMRIAAGAGVTTLLTMSVISGSFAKYITSGTGNHFTRINIYYAGLIDDNVNHCAYTEYQKTF
jgi:hypothetical protein